MNFFCLRRLLNVFVLLLVCTTAVAADAAPVATASATVAGKAETAIRARLAATMSGVAITSVAPSPIAGLYEVVLDGSETAFVSADGGYLISGDLYQAMPGKGLVNVTDQRKGGLRRDALAKSKRTEMVTFAAKGREKAFMYVFTDVDCGYCRKLHQEVPQLNAAGITVHYLAFPRSGITGDTFRTMEAIWCAADRNKALTDSKRGATVPPAPVACKSPVADQYRLGVALGVRGTPAIFLADGSQVGGYVPAAELIKQLVK